MGAVAAGVNLLVPLPIPLLVVPITLALLVLNDGMVPVILSALGASAASLRAAVLARYRKAS